MRIVVTLLLSVIAYVVKVIPLVLPSVLLPLVLLLRSVLPLPSARAVRLPLLLVAPNPTIIVVHLQDLDIMEGAILV